MGNCVYCSCSKTEGDTNSSSENAGKENFTESQGKVRKGETVANNANIIEESTMENLTFTVTDGENNGKGYGGTREHKDVQERFIKNTSMIIEESITKTPKVMAIDGENSGKGDGTREHQQENVVNITSIKAISKNPKVTGIDSEICSEGEGRIQEPKGLCRTWGAPECSSELCGKERNTDNKTEVDSKLVENNKEEVESVRNASAEKESNACKMLMLKHSDVETGKSISIDKVSLIAVEKVTPENEKEKGLSNSETTKQNASINDVCFSNEIVTSIEEGDKIHVDGLTESSSSHQSSSVCILARECESMTSKESESNSKKEIDDGSSCSSSAEIFQNACNCKCCCVQNSK